MTYCIQPSGAKRPRASVQYIAYNRFQLRSTFRSVAGISQARTHTMYGMVNETFDPDKAATRVWWYSSLVPTMNTGDSSDIEELDDSGSKGNYPGVTDYESAHPSPRSNYFQYPYGASQMFSSVAPNFAQHPQPTATKFCSTTIATATSVNVLC